MLILLITYQARAAVADMHELSRETTRRTDPDLLSDTDESDVSLSSESEGESDGSDFNLDDDADEEVNGVTQTLGWWKKVKYDPFSTYTSWSTYIFARHEYFRSLLSRKSTKYNGVYILCIYWLRHGLVVRLSTTRP